jgi:hypothetical protein
MYIQIFLICFQSAGSFPEGEFRDHCPVQSESKAVSWSIRRVCLAFKGSDLFFFYGVLHLCFSMECYLYTLVIFPLSDVLHSYTLITANILSSFFVWFLVTILAVYYYCCHCHLYLLILCTLSFMPSVTVSSLIRTEILCPRKQMN